MKIQTWLATAILAGAAVLSASAHAASTLSGIITADNVFSAYVSTDNSQLGTLVGTSSNWQGGVNLTPFTLVAGQTYYLHIVADNLNFAMTTVVPGDLGGGNPDGLLGQLSLSGTGHVFANGGTSLLTSDLSAWSATGEPTVGSSWSAPSGPSAYSSGYSASAALNGGSNIWAGANGGPISGISTGADWIWSQTDPTGEAFFSTTISAVPEPATWAVMFVGFGGLGAAMRSKRRKQAAAAATA